MCPTSKYRFSFYVTYEGYAGYGFNTTVAAYLDDVMIVPTQLTCSDAAQCDIPATNGWRLVTAPDLITPPENGIAILKLVFVRASTAPGDPPLQDTFLDYVTITKVS